MNEIGGCFEIAMQSDFSFYNRNCQGLEKFIRLPVKKMIEKRDIGKLNSSVIEILWYRIHDKLNKLKLTVVSKMTSCYFMISICQSNVMSFYVKRIIFDLTTAEHEY